MTAIDHGFQTYLDALRRIPLDQKTEHTDRAALETLLTSFAPSGVTVQHEPKRQDDKGSPDFKITARGAVLGYVEVKTIGENLDAVLKSAQIKKYRFLSDNILLTDYLHVIWIGPHGIERETLAYPDDLESRKHKLNPDRAASVARLLRGFFSAAPTGIARAQDLAAALAARSHLLRDGLTEALAHQAAHNQQGRLFGLYNAFRAQVFHELELGEFADAFAQMLAYGLFLARLNTEETITLDNARQFVPGAFPLIRELIDFIGELRAPDYAPIRWLVEEILSIMNGLDLAAIRADLSFSNRKAIRRTVRAGSEEEHRLFERDPFVYFYEDFLAKYDAKLRKSRGVYYTPPPVVNFIIRAVDDLLRSEFGIADGLADHRRVTLLDFATGTGTFLLEALERMFETIGDSEAKRALLVREHVLRNVFGFEYLIAPYTIAHLKLSQYLKDKGIGLQGAERLRIYLTNTLEPIARNPIFYSLRSAPKPKPRNRSKTNPSW
ncbi:N-6 DNA methylase [Acidiphilium iwatense]|uniref:site-specific DNA-methyltransferase (adenine-specific) n=1 Tax=Acidiphilium iwatense TaxID=768198 RepID=A0ABS9DW17_9PROT|nr:N-6 DNA methylase [Acidiphilium iwatense]MCF3946941.1 N-6 DNA methylase [Acidiphilium iwatense]